MSEVGPGALRWAVLAGPAALWTVVAGVGLARAGADRAAWAPVDRGFGEVAGSQDCGRCHPRQHASWYRSYHRTMTQRVDDPGAIVLAPFAGEQLAYGGFLANMDRDPEGRPRVRITAEDGGDVLIDARVELTVGTHRYQQYVARIDRGGGAEERWRLPVAWHPEAGRWVHLNGAFLEPEAAEGDAEGYLRHLSRWNDNCIFCHNTEPVPGRRAAGEGAHFDSSVGEIGIGCEACHGPGEDHVRRHADPFRRLLARGRGDPSITHPGRLSPARATDLCARCHGQRIALDIEAVMRSGDGFLPGEELAAGSRPIWAEAELAGHGPRPFAARFWEDGTPRLSAYEAQALWLSPCHDGGAGLDCNHCHDMHDAPPAGQVRPGREGAGACVDCHPQGALSGAATAGGHGGHGAAAPEVSCLDCHMPWRTFGLTRAMRSHRIDVPDPAGRRGADTPDACTSCHTERSRAWAVAALDRDYGPDPGDAPAGPLAARLPHDLLAGDPLVRALAAAALARPGATGDPSVRAAWLAEALDDPYPGVRWVAWRGMVTLAPTLADPALEAAVQGFDPQATLEDRVAQGQVVRARLSSLAGSTLRRAGPEALGEATIDALRAGAEGVEIWIGE